MLIKDFRHQAIVREEIGPLSIIVGNQCKYISLWYPRFGYKIVQIVIKYTPLAIIAFERQICLDIFGITILFFFIRLCEIYLHYSCLMALMGVSQTCGMTSA